MPKKKGRTRYGHVYGRVLKKAATQVAKGSCGVQLPWVKRSVKQLEKGERRK